MRHELAPYDTYVAACWPERLRNINLENAGMRAELARVEPELAVASADLSQRNSGLAIAQAEIVSLGADLATTKTKLMATKTELATTRTELATTAAELKTSKTELANAQNELVLVSERLKRVTEELGQTHTALAEKRPNSSAAGRIEIQPVQQKLKAVYSSRYWRFTRLWRELDTYLRNRRRARRERKRSAGVQMHKPWEHFLVGRKFRR